MFPKIWPRLPIFIAVLLLLSTSLSACWPFPSVSINPSATPTQSEIKCVLDIGEVFVSGFISSLDDDHPADDDVEDDNSDLNTDCFQAIADFVGQLQFSNNQGPEAVVKQHSVDADSTFSYTFNSPTLPNCTSTPVSGTYSYNLPLVLVVGTLDANNQFQNSETYVEPIPSIPASTDGSYKLFPQKGAYFPATTDAQLIAKQLYTDQDFPDNYFNKPGQPSDSFPLTLPANSTVTLHLPLTMYYRAGDGEVIRNGQAGQSMQWAYVYQGARNFDPSNLTTGQMTVTPCT